MYISQISLHANTPSVTVFDARGLRVRDLRYHRHPDSPSVTNSRITSHQYDGHGFLVQSADPRLNDMGLANFTHVPSLSGRLLSQQGVDSGSCVTLPDAVGRSCIVVSNIPGVDDQERDRNQVVTCTYQYEGNYLRGRLVSVTERVGDGIPQTSERMVYAANTEAEMALNVAGQCVSHYDTAGLIQTDSVALTGVPLSITRRLFKNANDPDSVVDWRGESASGWNGALDEEAFTSLVTTDATGALHTTTDAAGNLQRIAYDVAGAIRGHWLTIKDRAEQVVVKSLTYSAACQKLREESGNGVVTVWTYEEETQRLSGIGTQRPAGHTSGAKVLQDLKYVYDPVGNVSGERNDSQAPLFWRNQKVLPENTYMYDTLYQLVSAIGREMANAEGQCSSPLVCGFDDATYTNYTRAYRYDMAGNLIQIRHIAPASRNNHTTKVTISNRSNRGVLNTLATNPNEVEALFSASGQQEVLQPGQQLFWTPRNELSYVTPVSRDGAVDDHETYRYDSGSQRVLKFSAQKVSRCMQGLRVVYLPSLELRTKYDGTTMKESLQVICADVSGRSRLRALHWENPRPKTGSDLLHYSYDNVIGSSALVLDGEGKVVSQEEYYPFGGTAVWVARNAIEASFKTVRYSGKERDATGLYYYGWRYYQPWVGRWLSADPAGTADGMNVFAIVGNNPVTFFDTNGLYKDGQEARQMVGETYVHPLHMPAFEKVSKEHNIAVSIRESGSYTIKALGEGAAAKGHNILEKTIKPASLKAAYGDGAEAMLAQAENSGLVGRVGQWGRDGVRGLYARNSISDEDVSYSVNLQRPIEHELLDAWVRFKVVTPYTGDYDMHDIIQIRGGRGTVPGAGGSEEAHVMDSINHAIAELDPARPFHNTSMNMIRHGPQVNFVSHMWRHELDKVKQDNGYLEAVARPGPFPIAMVYQGQWSIIESSRELFDFYKSANTAVPEHWAQGFVSRGNGMVATPRHARALDWHRSNTL
jgi:insecticidal toxin complex protein TccC